MSLKQPIDVGQNPPEENVTATFHFELFFFHGGTVRYAARILAQPLEVANDFACSPDMQGSHNLVVAFFCFLSS